MVADSLLSYFNVINIKKKVVFHLSPKQNKRRLPVTHVQHTASLSRCIVLRLRVRGRTPNRIHLWKHFRVIFFFNLTFSRVLTEHFAFCFIRIVRSTYGFLLFRRSFPPASTRYLLFTLIVVTFTTSHIDDRLFISFARPTTTGCRAADNAKHTLNKWPAFINQGDRRSAHLLQATTTYWDLFFDQSIVGHWSSSSLWLWRLTRAKSSFVCRPVACSSIPNFNRCSSLFVFAQLFWHFATRTTSKSKSSLPFITPSATNWEIVKQFNHVCSSELVIQFDPSTCNAFVFVSIVQSSFFISKSPCQSRRLARYFASGLYVWYIFTIDSIYRLGSFVTCSVSPHFPSFCKTIYFKHKGKGARCSPRLGREILKCHMLGSIHLCRFANFLFWRQR